LEKIKITIFLLFLFGLTINAQDNLEERISDVENTVSKIPRIIGNINLRFRYDDLAPSNGFDVRRARLDIRGNVISPLEYRIHVDFANSPRMLDANIVWKINKHVSLLAGQYKIPFSLENPYNPNVLEFIENSLVITHLVNYSDVSGMSANGRDIGVSLTGNFFQREGYSLINYFFGVFNGSGINTSDTNKEKDFSGILSFNPAKNLTFAVSHYNGTLTKTTNRVRYGYGVKYDDKRFLLRSEYIHGKTDFDSKADDGSDITEYFKSEGAYAVLGYYVLPKLQMIGRYDCFETGNSLKNNTKQTDYSMGCNYFPVNNVRLQLNYIYKTAKSKQDNTHIVTQLWVRF